MPQRIGLFGRRKQKVTPFGKKRDYDFSGRTKTAQVISLINYVCHRKDKLIELSGFEGDL